MSFVATWDKTAPASLAVVFPLLEEFLLKEIALLYSIVFGLAWSCDKTKKKESWVQALYLKFGRKLIPHEMMISPLQIFSASLQLLAVLRVPL